MANAAFRFSSRAAKHLSRGELPVPSPATYARGAVLCSVAGMFCYHLKQRTVDMQEDSKNCVVTERTPLAKLIQEYKQDLLDESSANCARRWTLNRRGHPIRPGFV